MYISICIKTNSFLPLSIIFEKNSPGSDMFKCDKAYKRKYVYCNRGEGRSGVGGYIVQDEHVKQFIIQRRVNA